MAKRDPNQIGTVWIKEGMGKGAGRMFFGGPAFDIPEGGLIVKLEPFSFVKDDGTMFQGWNVIKL